MNRLSYLIRVAQALSIGCLVGICTSCGQTGELTLPEPEPTHTPTEQPAQNS